MAPIGSFDLLRPQEQFVYVTFAEEEAQPTKGSRRQRAWQ
jgi:hypothetical protein